MFKVICPIERPNGGGTYWMRAGNAFTNKDESINVYCDVMPAPGKDGFKFQLRELTEEELKERAEKRSSYQSRNSSTTTSADGSLPF